MHSDGDCSCGDVVFNFNMVYIDNTAFKFINMKIKCFGIFIMKILIFKIKWQGISKARAWTTPPPQLRVCPNTYQAYNKKWNGLLEEEKIVQVSNWIN